MQSQAPSPSSGVDLSSLEPQIAQLQVTVQPNAPVTASTSSSATSTSAKRAGANTPNAPQPLFSMNAANLATPLSESGAHLPAPTVLSAANPNASGPQADHGRSQDNLSNHDAKTEADSSSTGTGVAHDVSSFAQAMPADTAAKPEPTLAVPATTPALAALTAASSGGPANSSAAASAQEAPAPLPQPVLHPSNDATTRIVNDAQLVQNATHSEMRIAMQTDNLGAVELRAHVAGDAVGASILVEKRDAHAALAVELPALQQALSEKQLRVDQIALTHGPLHASSGDAGAQSQAQNGDRGAQRANAAQFLPASNVNPFSASQLAAETKGIFDSQGRLSVRA